MWWINKFGSISGPYSDEQIRKLVQTNRLTRLCKISDDRATWVRIDESIFWGRSANVPEGIELPSTSTMTISGVGSSARPRIARIGSVTHHDGFAGQNQEPVHDFSTSQDKVNPPTAEWSSDSAERQDDSIGSKFASAIGIASLRGFNLSELLSETFSRHTKEDIENVFVVGTRKSTPDILRMEVSWPKPWLFARMVIASVVLYLLFYMGWKAWGNPKLLPGLMFIGSFAIPISTLVLFFEFNVWRNVSLYMVARLVLFGGVVSLITTHVILDLIDKEIIPNAWISNVIGASIAGPVEETAKVVSVVVAVSAAKYRYKLNGLLFGAAVGVGFAAFESMGYAWELFTQINAGVTLEAAAQSGDFAYAHEMGMQYGANVMFDNIVMRGLLSPLGHIVWSAIAGCALWRVIKGRAFKWRMLCDEKFIRLLLVPVFLHMIWNSPFALPYYGKYIIVGVVGWWVCLSLVREGLCEIADEQRKVMTAGRLHDE